MKRLSLDLPETLPIATYPLPKNHSRKIPKHILFFDVETYPTPIEVEMGSKICDAQEHHFRLAYFESFSLKDGKYENDFLLNTPTKNPKVIVDRLFPKSTRIAKSFAIFAHNLRFDFNAILPYISLEDQNRIAEFSFKRGQSFIKIIAPPDEKTRYTYYFIDSMNYYNTSIEQLGKIFGLEKVGKDIDFENVSDEELEKRCIQDVVILRTAIINLIEKMIIPSHIRMPITASSMAFSIYRNHYMHYPIIIHKDEKLRKFERASYHGGRVEVFDLNQYEHVYGLDVNAMYSFVMKNFSYPIKPIQILYNPSVTHLKKLLKHNFCMTAKAIVDTDRYIPAYPFKFNEKLLFPIGKFETILTTPEILYAIEKKELVEVPYAVIYKSAPIFYEYASDMSQKKENAKENNNKVMYLFYKLLGNSLYGKFAQQIDKWEKTFDFEGNGVINYFGKDIKVKTIFNNSWISTEKRDGSLTSITISSHITAYARMYLLKLLEKAKNPIYCDTDSLFIPESDLSKYEKMIHKSKLGMLDIEYEDIEFQAKLPKVYSFTKNGQTYNKRKGIPKKSREIASGIFQYDYVLGFHETLNKFNEPKLIFVTREKNINRKYDKRLINDDGTTKPIPIEMLY